MTMYVRQKFTAANSKRAQTPTPDLVAPAASAIAWRPNEIVGSRSAGRTLQVISAVTDAYICSGSGNLLDSRQRAQLLVPR